MAKFIKSLLIEEEGASMVEYALMVALIAAAAIVGVTAMGDAVVAKFGEITAAL